MFDKLFELAPTPCGLLKVDDSKLEDLLRPLGLQRRRAKLLRRLTLDYIEGKPPYLCHGVGQYALDAWAIFVEGRTDVKPSDHFLKPYLKWRKKHGNPTQWPRPQAGGPQAPEVVLRAGGPASCGAEGAGDAPHA